MWCPRKCGGVCPLPTESYWSSLSLFQSFTIYTDCSLVRCVKCKTPVKDTDAVLDAVRVGQEALDKAEALQFSSACSSHPTIQDDITDFIRSTEINPTYYQSDSHRYFGRPRPSCASATCSFTLKHISSHNPSTDCGTSH